MSHPLASGAHVVHWLLGVREDGAPRWPRGHRPQGTGSTRGDGRQGADRIAVRRSRPRAASAGHGSWTRDGEHGGGIITGGGIASGIEVGFHMLRRTGYSEAWISEVARVMEYAALAYSTFVSIALVRMPQVAWDTGGKRAGVRSRFDPRAPGGGRPGPRAVSREVFRALAS